jgi:hypothetical protein
MSTWNARSPSASTIDVLFVGELDLYLNPIGAKGVGEIGIVGVAPPIANAVHHTTGRRIRDLPRLVPSCPTTVALTVCFGLRLAGTLSKAAWISVARPLRLTRMSPV